MGRSPAWEARLQDEPYVGGITDLWCDARHSIRGRRGGNEARRKSVMDDEHPATMIGSPVELTRADYVEIKITADRVYVHTENGMMFRAYRVGKLIVQDERDDPPTDGR